MKKSLLAFAALLAALSVFAQLDVLGRKINTLVDGVQSAGKKRIIWNGTDESAYKVNPGIYICILRMENKISNRKMLLMGN